MAGKKRTGKWIECVCQGCGKIFHVPPNQVKHGRGKYCSPTCLSRAGGVAMRAKHPMQRRAINEDDAVHTHNKVNRAIRAGKLQRGSCVVCGTTESICAHHEDYRKPFDIVWFCTTHHVQYHMGLVDL